MINFQLTHATAAFLKPEDCELFCPVMTQEQVASRLGISQPTVNRLERSALRKLKTIPEARALLSLVRFTPQL